MPSANTIFTAFGIFRWEIFCLASALLLRLKWSREVKALKVLRRMLRMCEPSWELLIRGLQLSCVLLFCAFLLLLDAGSFSVWNCNTYYIAKELLTLPQAILLVVILAGVIIEERRA